MQDAQKWLRVQHVGRLRCVLSSAESRGEKDTQPLRSLPEKLSTTFNRWCRGGCDFTEMWPRWDNSLIQDVEVSKDTAVLASGAPLKVYLNDASNTLLGLHARFFVPNVSEAVLLRVSCVGNIFRHTLAVDLTRSTEAPPFALIKNSTVKQPISNTASAIQMLPANYLRNGIVTVVVAIMEKATYVAEVNFFTYHMGDTSCLCSSFRMTSAQAKCLQINPQSILEQTVRATVDGELQLPT